MSGIYEILVPWKLLDITHTLRDRVMTICGVAFRGTILIYNWFTEGYDTVDLKEAKVLLGSLS